MHVLIYYDQTTHLIKATEGGPFPPPFRYILYYIGIYFSEILDHNKLSIKTKYRPYISYTSGIIALSTCAVLYYYNMGITYNIYLTALHLPSNRMALRFHFIL